MKKINIIQIFFQIVIKKKIGNNIFKYKGKEIINIKDQFEHFNNYFSNVGHKINESFVNNDNNITNDNDFRFF